MKITQTETNISTVKSFIVTEQSDGTVCTATGGTVSNDHPLSRTFPGDFKPLGGVGSCSTNTPDTFEVETTVVVKSSHNGNDEDKGQGDDHSASSNGDKSEPKVNDNKQGGDINNGNDNSQGGGDKNNKENDECGDQNDGNSDGQSHTDNNGDCVVTHKVSFETSFFVLPEIPVGTVGLIGSSLAALGGFLYFKRPF